MTPEMESERLLSAAGVDRLVKQIEGYAKTGTTEIEIVGWWSLGFRWARNRVSVASDRRDIYVSLDRVLPKYGRGRATTNQLDAVSLEATVRAAERAAQLQRKREKISDDIVVPTILPTPEPKIWSDATYAVTAAEQGEIARNLIVDSEAQNMLSAGYLEIRAFEVARYYSGNNATLDGWQQGQVHYSRATATQCSMTVRHPKGVGSGWAGRASFDWSALQSADLGARALEKCMKSLNPVAIEPGRYTVVLEPQAVYELVSYILFNRMANETSSGHPFSMLGADGSRGTKLGLQVIDERLSITHDPMHAQLGILPEPGLAPITIINRGVLTTLDYNRQYALRTLRRNTPALARTSFQMSGGNASVDEMIRSTRRGLLVTRFSNIEQLDMQSVLLSGVTRDGLWLIENGQISKAVKNMRFTESPLFVLNQVEQIGASVPVFPSELYSNPWLTNGPNPKSWLIPSLVPALKTKDFSFTSMIDAI